MTARAASWEHNTVHLWNSSFINQTSQTKSQDNADAVVLTISPNRNASLVGSGPRGAPLQPDFGCRDFRMHNVNVMNRAVRVRRWPSLNTDLPKWHRGEAADWTERRSICGVRERQLLQLLLRELPRHPVRGAERFGVFLGR